MRSNVVCVLLFVVALLGCQKVSSSDVRTSGMFADLRAVVRAPDTVEVTAALRVGGPTSNTFVELSGDDRLVVRRGDERKVTMSAQSGAAGLLYYAATLELDATNEEIIIALERDRDEDAPESVLTVPTAFDLESPTEGETFSRDADAIPLAWSDADSSDEMRWSIVDGDWVVPLRRTDIPGDPGSWSINPGEIRALAGQEDTTGTITIEVSRSRTGELDEAWGGGTIEASQARRVEIRSAP